MSEQNKRVVMAYVDAFNRGDLDGVCALFAGDALIHGVLGWGGLEAARPIWGDLMRCFQVSLEVDGVVSEGDAVAVRYTERGRSVAAFRGGPVTGRDYELIAIEWFVVKEGHIERRWGVRDASSMFRQMGLPTPYDEAWPAS
ncbi:ester cyclase [Dyella solisilvae]|uniref:ester cyclase n=1 Tax=Dyella solisilvae TaxID=1920168 RepID=UPI0018F5186A|nr:ester cyclase [Dyella solisilvae]